MTKKLARLVLVIDLTHIAEDARLTEAKNYTNRAMNDGILAETDTIELECEDEEVLCSTASDFALRRNDKDRTPIS